MTLFRFVLPALFLAVAVLVNLQPGHATVEYTKKEKKSCVTCHVGAKKKELNDVGKCYEKKKDLKACQK